MAEETRGLSVGQNVPDFEMDTFEPGTGKFGTFRL
ncbi:MAG: peroxiredoxin, partial [Deltaproteobacteria bacterium CG_4_9_14_3_um_filter_65_9]